MILLVFSLLPDCRKYNPKVPVTVNEAAGLHRIDTIVQGVYTFYIYKKDTGSLVVGYNEIYLQLKNKTTGEFIENANLSWKPLIHMPSVSQTCPYSGISKVPNTNTLYTGYFIFIRATGNADYWEITYDYTNGTDTLARFTDRPDVINPAGLSRYRSFVGADSVSSYFLALVNPTQAQVGSNVITVYLYQEINLLSFTEVVNYTIQTDPAMPEMGNMTSPNNINLTYNSGIYEGKLNLTMNGYWKINLIVLNASDSIVGGNAVTASNTASSLYFEIEF
jgi:hypothetical protein